MKKKILSMVLAVAVAASLIPATTKADELTGTLYGTATLSYTEYYQNDTSVEEYDAVTSATTTKYEIMSNQDSTTPVEGVGYQILGVKNVPVAVDAEIYNAAKEYESAGTLDEQDAVYQKAAKITLNAEPNNEVAQYKTLNADGTYSATKWNVADTVTDATAVLKTTSVWGAYEVDITETSTSYIRNTREDTGFAINGDIQGLILETTEGEKVGLRHLEEIWVQPYEFSFNLNTIAAEKLIGKTINKVSYIMSDATYVYTFADGIYFKPQVAAENSFTAEMAKDFKSVSIDTSNLPSDIEDVKVTVYHKVGRSTTYYAQSATISDGKVELTEAASPNTDYTVIVESGNYADKSISITSALADINDYADKITLSESSYVYDGTEKKPVVTIEGLEEGTDFTVAYTNNVNAGKATVTVTGTGNYTGTVSKEFEITQKTNTTQTTPTTSGTSANNNTNTKKVTQTKVKVAKVKKLTLKALKSKKIKITWKKVAKATGYEIQYSTNKNFKKATKVTVKKASKVSKTISKLKAKKKYYVRIRAYKTVSGNKYTGSWTKKSVKTKK